MSSLLLIIICFGIPIGGLWYLSKSKRQVWIPFISGAAAFFISQMVLRLPLLNYLSTRADFYLFSFQVISYGILLSFTAGLFEETARHIGFKCLKKHSSLKDAIAFGLGHGGIEAILLVSMPAIFQSVDMTSAMLSGAERIFAMMAHIVFSIIVWYGVKQHRIIYLVIAIVLHMLYNAAAFFALQLWHLPIIEVEMMIGAISILLCLGCFVFIKKKERN